MIYHTHLLWFTGAITLTQNLIIINSKYTGDAPLLKHEQVHQAQMHAIGTFTFWWRYLTSSQKRQAFEVEAYKVQIAAGATRASCSKHLSTMYRLGLTYDEAYALLGGTENGS